MKTFTSKLILIASQLAFFVGMATAKETRPNILFIVCDDLNTHVSPSGYNSISTPSLQAFAGEAMTFRRAYCQYPVCGPSRASFLNGLYPETAGVVDNKADIRQTRPGTISMPQLFKENGYWTASVGKVFHSPRHEHGEMAWNEFLRFDNEELPLITAARQKFEADHGSVDDRKNRKAWKELSKKLMAPIGGQTPPGFGPSGLQDAQHKDGKNVRQVVQWLEQEKNGKQPFFIACGIQKPHVPFLAPQKYFDQYPPDSLSYTLDPSNLWDHLPKSASSPRYTSFGFELGKENETLRRQYMQAYHACISFIDAQLGLVFDSLKKKGLWDNTIIVFTSDHGYQLGEHFMWGKVTLFEVCDRVPMMIRVPGMTRPGTLSQGLVELIDLYPTLAELSGIEAPGDLQGRSMVPMLRDPKAPGKQLAYTVVSRGQKLGRAIRTKDWRYAEWPDGEELYFLSDDPEERINLASHSDHKERLLQMRKHLAEKRLEIKKP